MLVNLLLQHHLLVSMLLNYILSSLEIVLVYIHLVPDGDNAADAECKVQSYYRHREEDLALPVVQEGAVDNLEYQNRQGESKYFDYVSAVYLHREVFLA